MIFSKFRITLLSRPSMQRALKFGKTAFSPRYLLYTNVIIGGQIAATGDVLQQSYQLMKPNNKEWDRKRTASMLAMGACLTPICHFWYLNLDKFLPGNSIKIVVIKLIPDILLFSPSYVLLFLMMTGVLEGQSWNDFKKEIKHKIMGFLLVEVCLWTPAQFLNFFFLPTRFRVLFDNLVSLIADVFYSYFRYDYQIDDRDDFKTIEEDI